MIIYKGSKIGITRTELFIPKFYASIDGVDKPLCTANNYKTCLDKAKKYIDDRNDKKGTEKE